MGFASAGSADNAPSVTAAHPQARGGRPAPLPAHPFVSVVVPAYNRAAFIPACLASLCAQTYPRERYEIVVVDDGSTDGTAEAARSAARAWGGALRVVAKPNGGPASARNAGIRAATGEVVAFTDCDCTADPDWLECLVGALVGSGASGVGGPLANVAQAGWVARFLDATAFYRHRVRRGAVDYLLTANVAFRRDALLAVGGFAERAGAWGEDADLSFRLRRAGHRLALAPAGGVTHHGSPASVRGLARELYRYGHGNAVLSRGWANGRTPAVELARHGGALLLSPLLALRHARRVGLWAAASFWPLIAIEHGAFSAGLLRGALRRPAHAEAGRGADGALDGAAISERPLVSVVMPVRNEAAHIARSLGAVLAQDYPVDRLEVLLVDGASDDETVRIARSLPGAGRVRVIPNPRRVQAAGLNLGIREARGAVVARVDGHTVVAPDYVRACVAALRATGAANVGGHMRPVGETPTGRAIALATTTAFGVPAAFHVGGGARDADTVYLGAWPRAVLERAGGFDEGLRANEDYELNHRIRRAGGRIFLSPTIRSEYHCRQSFAGLARQYFAYGVGKAGMLRRHPASLRPRQLAAPAFVAALALGAPLAARLRWARAPWLLMLAAYAALNLGFTARLARGAGRGVAWRIPLVYLTLHASWGAGFWAGIAGAPARRAAAAGRGAEGGRQA